MPSYVASVLLLVPPPSRGNLSGAPPLGDRQLYSIRSMIVLCDPLYLFNFSMEMIEIQFVFQGIKDQNDTRHPNDQADQVNNRIGFIF